MTKQKENFSDYIKRRRIELGLTQQEVAKRAKVAQNFVTYLESDQRRPSTEMIKKLADILMLPSDKLYFLAHGAKLKGVIEFDQKGLKAKISPVLAALKDDQELRERHQISDEEIDQLASIRGRGEIRSKDDYVFLLMNIRQVFK